MNYSLCASLALLLTISQAVAEATEELNEPTDNSKKKMPTGVIVAIVVVVGAWIRRTPSVLAFSQGPPIHSRGHRRSRRFNLPPQALSQK